MIRNAMFIAVLAALTSCVSSPPPEPPAWAQAGWTELDTGSDASLRGLCVLDGGVVWASGSGGTVLRSLDGGSTWSRHRVRARMARTYGTSKPWMIGQRGSSQSPNRRVFFAPTTVANPGWNSTRVRTNDPSSTPLLSSRVVVEWFSEIHVKACSRSSGVMTAANGRGGGRRNPAGSRG